MSNTGSVFAQDLSFGEVTVSSISTVSLSWRSSTPYTFRQVQFPDGRIELQGGYAYGNELEQGIQWEALPLVQVDAQGEAL